MTPDDNVRVSAGAAWWEEALGAACWGHSPWPRMSVRDGAATMATNAGGGGGGGGPASPIDLEDRSYLLQIYPRLAAQTLTCCNLRWDGHRRERVEYLCTSIWELLLCFYLCLKGHLLCKIPFCMSLLHQHVSPLCKEILKVSWKKILSFCPDPFL